MKLDRPYQIKNGILTIQCSFKNKDNSITERFCVVTQPVYHFQDIRDDCGKLIRKELVIEHGRVEYNGSYYFAQGTPPLFYTFTAVHPIASRLIIPEAK